MLTPNSILNQGRYRILSCFWNTATHSLYEANDNIFGQKVVIHEGPDPRTTGRKIFDRDADSRQFTARFNRLKAFTHESLIGVRDHFYHADRKYLVSDNSDGYSVSQLTTASPAKLDPAAVITGLERVVDAYSRFANATGRITYFATDPGSIRTTANGRLRFMYFGEEEESSRDPYSFQSNPYRSGLAFMPLESIWGGLDVASQKVISNSYEERLLEALETPPDFRSDIFTLGSVSYFLLTGKVPVGPLERAIDVLEGKIDPLIPVHATVRAVSEEISGFIARSMSLYRNDRFDSFATISRQLSVLVADLEPEKTLPRALKADPSDDSELLEIPSEAPELPLTAAEPLVVIPPAQTEAKPFLPRPAGLANGTRIVAKAPPRAPVVSLPTVSPMTATEAEPVEEKPTQPVAAETGTSVSTMEETNESPEPLFGRVFETPADPMIAPVLEARTVLPDEPEAPVVFTPTLGPTALGLGADNSQPERPFTAAADLFAFDTRANSTFLDSTETPRQWLRSPAVVIVPVALVLVLGAWFGVSLLTSDTTATSNQIDATSAVTSEPVVDREPVVTVEPERPVETTLPVKPETETSSSEPAQAPAISKPEPAAKTRKSVTEVKTRPEARPETAANPKTKKKVTVDDLISDN